MRLENLKLINYRNCTDLELNFGAGKILIAGKNAQGKTNILESICFLSTLRSPRTSNNLELINFGAQSVGISAGLIKADTHVELDFAYNTDKNRILKVNGAKSSSKDFKSVLKTVLFSTADLLLLRGNPSDRRDWLDRAISQIYPAYDGRLSKYDKIRIQKNNFLKEGVQNDALLDVFNEQLIVTGSNIIYLRKKFLKEIEKIACEKHRVISETEELRIEYGSFTSEEGTEGIARDFASALEERRAEELRRGQACVGPHRDDVVFFINNDEAAKFASQGQQRTIVLALKLSELDIITEKTGDEPVLLLDDVLAELDDVRQNYLLKSIGETTQTIITSVDTVFFEEKFLKDIQVYAIAGGKLQE
ncbi:MAG: DNA replication/repair protein RecF [Heliobacteriaceae bacterium]|jgi:DNA replication and repair protein RecF|nr:DNA replication/repair protein RecF [Heliobacteriaceae bacterium]